MNHSAFYQVAAQVIPVLALALILEQRFFQRRTGEPLAVSLSLLAILVALATGELLALTALLEDQPPSPLREALVLLALTFGLIELFRQPLADRLAALHESLPSWLVATARVGWPFVVIGMVILTLVLDSPIPIEVAVFAFVVGSLTVSPFLALRKERAGDPATEGEDAAVSPPVSPTGPNGANSAQLGDTETPAQG